MRKRKRNKKSGLGITIFIVFSICGLVLVKKHDLDQEQVAKVAYLKDLEEDYEKEQELAKELEELEIRMETRKFKEEVARDKFGLIYEDEYIFKSKEK